MTKPAVIETRKVNKTYNVNAAPVTALGWNAGGSMLAFGTEDGDAGVIDLSS